MNRARKYRVWDSRFNKWVDPSVVIMDLSNGDIRGCRGGPGGVEHWELEELSGLQDVDGNCLYEGDIFEDEEHCYHAVEYCLETLSFITSDKECLADFRSCYIKRIGNIHDNPELLAA